jgi:hypothetical protein
MPKFQMTERTGDWRKVPTRWGAGSGAANRWDDKEVGKAVKLVGESRNDLCAIGDDIEGWCVTVETATADDFSYGTLGCKGYKVVTLDGSQAAGTGTIAVGDFVVSGTQPARGTALTTPMKVRKATDQALAKASPHACRVVSLGTAGTGAVGTLALIEQL